MFVFCLTYFPFIAGTKYVTHKFKKQRSIWFTICGGFSLESTTFKAGSMTPTEHF